MHDKLALKTLKHRIFSVYLVLLLAHGISLLQYLETKNAERSFYVRGLSIFLFIYVL